jgi:membrane associated rhomboid family serine protease
MARSSSRPTALRLAAHFPGTLGIVALTIVFFGLEHALGGGMDTEILLRLGSMRADRVSEHWELWRLVTPMLLHFGAVHLVLNMLALAQLGPLVEGFWGTRRMVVFYVVCGLASSLTSAAFNPVGRPGSVGASGAIMGLAGVLLGASSFGDPRIRAELAVLRRPLFRGVALTLFIGLALVLWQPVVVVDNSAHVGGLLTGMLIAFGYPDPIAPDDAEETRRRRSSMKLGFAGTLLVVIASVASMGLHGPRAVATLAPDMAELSAIRVSRRPTDLVAILEMIDWHTQAGEIPQLVERVERALEKFEDPANVSLLAEVLNAQSADGKDRDEVQELVLERWLALTPDDPAALNAAAWHLVTRPNAAKRDPLRAEALSRKSLERIDDPASRYGKGLRAAYLDTLAEALFLQARYDEARGVQQEAVDLARDIGLELADLEDRLRKIERALRG